MSDNIKSGSEKKRMLLLTDGNIDHGSSRIRAVQYIPFFEKTGFEVSFIPRIGRKPQGILARYMIFPVVKRYYWIKRIYSLCFKSWDIIFIQRSFLPEFSLRKQKKRTPVVFDFDDAIYLSGSRSVNRKKTGNMIKYADEVIISTDYLNDFCRLYNKNGIIIPSPVETDRIMPAVKPVREKPVIGWIGSVSTTQHLEAAVPALQKLYREVPFILMTMGTRQDYTIKDIDHISKSWVFEEENSFLGEIDIGIMPLQDHEFQRAKGGYKLYLYMAAGIPCVASPVGVNRSVIIDGENGFLASSDEEWIAALRKLIADPELRRRMGTKGRSDAVNYYDRNICFEKLLECISRLI